MKIAEDAVGIVKGEASVIGYDFSAHPDVNLQFGEFVVAQNRNGEWVIGTIRKLQNINWLLISGKSTYQALQLDLEQYGESIEDNEEVIASVRVLGKLSFNG